MTVRPGRRVAVNVPVKPLRVKHSTYKVSSTLNKEARKARELHTSVHKAVSEVATQLETTGQADLKTTRKLASSMVDSVVRNPDAFAWLAEVRSKDEHIYSHCVRAAVWAIIFGRHIGLSEMDMTCLAQAVLLKDCLLYTSPSPRDA